MVSYNVLVDIGMVAPDPYFRVLFSHLSTLSMIKDIHNGVGDMKYGVVPKIIDELDQRG